MIKKKMIICALVSLFLAICLFSILSITGVYTFNRDKIYTSLNIELASLEQKLKIEIASVSVHCTMLAETLTKKTENRTAMEAYNQILYDYYDILVDQLIKARTGGVFLILDSSISADKTNSKSGLYLRNLEPNIVSFTDSDIRFYTGPSSIHRNKGIVMVPQWQMEFDFTQGIPSYYNTLKNLDKTISTKKNFLWTDTTTLDNLTNVILCCSPIYNTNHSFIGIAGYDISNMLFKLLFSPNSVNKDSLFLFTPVSSIDEETNSFTFSMDNTLIAGTAVNSDIIPKATIKCSTNDKICTFIDSDNKVFYGNHITLPVYQENSPFVNKEWKAILMMPEKLITTTNKISLLVQITSFVFFTVLFYFCLLFLVQKSKTKQNNLNTDIDSASQKNAITTSKTKVVTNNDITSNVLDNFSQNIKTLSQAELRVFNMYIKGATAKEVSEKLNISINTVKTHSQHIYEKLSISSRKELLLLTSMLNDIKNTCQ